jgi:hypothetical protein
MSARRSTILAALIVFATSGTVVNAQGALSASPNQEAGAGADSNPPPGRTGLGETKNERNQSPTGSNVVNGMATVPVDIAVELDLD